MNNVAVQETIHHGDVHSVRYIEVDLDNIEAVTEMLNTCSYLRLPEPDFGQGAVAASRSYDDIVAQRTADAENVAQKLAKNGAAEIGWVNYRVMQESDRATLQMVPGWGTARLNRCIR